MKIQILVATMYNSNIDMLIDDMNISSDCIVINQCNCICEKKYYLEKNGFKILVIDTPERGLSKSRNKALKNVDVDTDIIIFTDDDVIFENNYIDNIINAYQKSPNSDGIVFNVKRSNGMLNKNLGIKINQLNLFRVCSVSITLKYQKIKNIKFDEQFGAGSSKYCLGEENIYISDCLKEGLLITTNDYVMCHIENKRPSTWYKGINNVFLISKGASFKRMHKNLYLLFDLDFALRKYKYYRHKMSFFSALIFLVKGSKMFENCIGD